MAKISTYPTDSSVSGGDLLIGTDVDNSNATKNFSVSSLISYAATNNLVPYTGATQSVDLGVYGLSIGGPFFVADGSEGTSGQILSSQGPGFPPSWVDASSIIGGTYVPYTGAISDVNLGAHTLTTSSGVLLSGSNAPLNVNGSAGTSGYILKSNGSGTTPSWVSIASAVDGQLWKGSFYDSITQTLTGGANVAVPVILRTTDSSATNGISVVTDGTNLTRITVANTAVYNILFSAQLTNSGGSTQTVDFWLRKNGSTAAANIADTNGKVLLQANANYLMAAWNYFVALNAGDYIQLMWTATSTNISMLAEAANAVHPATPSIIVTMNQV